jgi:membrane protein
MLAVSSVVVTGRDDYDVAPRGARRCLLHPRTEQRRGATLLLCAVPFLLVAIALTGRSAVSALTVRLGLNQQAAADVGHLFTSSSATSNAVTGLSWAFFILAGIAAATAVQVLYLRVFGLDSRGLRDRLRAVIWLVLVVGWGAVATSVGPGFRASSPVLWWIVNIPAFIGLWWFTMWFLLAGRVSWRRLFPCAVATGAFWLGIYAVFSVIFSGMVISYDQKYGPIGVVFGLTGSSRRCFSTSGSSSP